MTGLKSGSGDDLWGDDEAAEDATEAEDRSGDEESTAENADTTHRESAAPEESGGDEDRPYIVRRAVRDKSVQFERDERLTFFVHGDVVEGERELLREVESRLGREVLKFDVREAVYRAALRNREDVVEELVEMGYTLDGE